MHTCVYIYIHKPIHKEIYIYIYTHTYIHTYIHTYVHACIHTHMYVYISIYIYIYIIGLLVLRGAPRGRLLDAVGRRRRGEVLLSLTNEKPKNRKKRKRQRKRQRKRSTSHFSLNTARPERATRRPTAPGPRARTTGRTQRRA